MSYAEEIKIRLRPESKNPIRAVIYARVSTENEGQKDSCANQVELAELYVSSHPNIELIATYVDDGISGKNDFTRPQYNQMLQLLSTDGFDLILTKSLSRLNRDQLNSLHLTNMLLEHNATVLTLEDGQIHDFEDINSELLHSIKYAIDAQYVKQQSINGHKTHELRCERKELSAKDCSYGYIWHKEDKTITVSEDQACIIRRIFEDYVYRNATPAEIARTLATDGISLCGRTISNIIADERYIGNFYINKRTTKLGTGRTKSRRIKLPKEQWVLCFRPDLKIIDPDLFELAQRVHKTRITIYEKADKKKTQAHFQGYHLFAGKIFCPICGKVYHYMYADKKKTLPIYMIKNHSSCSNPIRKIYEEDLVDLTQYALLCLIDDQDDICRSIERVLAEIVEASQNKEDDVGRLQKMRAAREKQLENLIDQLSEGGLTEAAKKRIKERLNSISEEIDRLSCEIIDKQANKLDDSFVSSRLSSIREAMNRLRNFTRFDRERILNYIDCIYMHPNGDIELILKSGYSVGIHGTERNDQAITDTTGTTNHELATTFKTGIQHARYSSPAACR